MVIHREVIMAPRLLRFVSRLRLGRTASLCMLCSALAVLLGTSAASGQTGDSYQSRRTQAFAFYESNNFVDALPLLDKLHAEKPDDVPVLERLSFATLAHSATLTDPSAQKQERARARKLGHEAKAAGDDSNLLKIVLSVPEDGGEVALAGTAEVQAAMQEGEAAFVKGDLDAPSPPTRGR